MSNKYLVGASLAMIVVSILGLAVFYIMRGGLPPSVDYNWPERDGFAGASRSEDEQRKLVMERRAQANGVARFLAGQRATERFERAAPKPDGKLEFDDKYDTREFFEGARFKATTVIILFYVLLACGLLGLLRLKVRGVVAAGLGVLTLAILGGGALLIFTGASTLAGIMLAIMLLAFFAQLVGANLMVGANHPFVVHAEDELRALPPDRRKAHIAKRVIGGILLTVFGAAMTALSLAIHAGVVVVATGAIAGGLFMMFTPLIASVRMRVAR